LEINIPRLKIGNPEDFVKRKMSVTREEGYPLLLKTTFRDPRDAVIKALLNDYSEIVQLGGRQYSSIQFYILE
jgi:hypothetical protein